MRSTEVNFPIDAVVIDSYAEDGFRLSGAIYRGAVCVFVDQAATWEGLCDLSPFLSRAHDIDILLLGLGAELIQPEAGFYEERRKLEAAGVGVEVMTTPSACRTYNVLLAEGRRVAAGLLPI
ncbi:MAG: Mth938-like domain-containing protein [Pseudomonadota bacterium]